jgi:hypothetical protein
MEELVVDILVELFEISVRRYDSSFKSQHSLDNAC